MKWVAREHLNVDPVASSWLIKTCVDPYAEFLFVPDAELVATAERVGTTPFDAARWAGGEGESSPPPLNIRGDARALQAHRSGAASDRPHRSCRRQRTGTHRAGESGP